MVDLKQVVADAQAGDGDAFGELVRRFQDMAVAYAASILHDFQLAEDAAQDAFLETFRALPQLRDPAAFPAWFRRWVYKQCDRYCRRKSSSATVSEKAENVPSDLPAPDNAMEFEERRALVRKAVGELPELERGAIMLYHTWSEPIFPLLSTLELMLLDPR